MSAALHKLYGHIGNFLSTGLLTHSPHVPSRAFPIPGAAAGMSLFEFMTMGRPEIRAQQALFPFLDQLYPGTVREYPFSKTFIDFWVPPQLVPGGVAIELKHYSAHQTGQFATLLGSPARLRFSLASDLVKPRPSGSRLIQVALYTAVEQLQRPLQRTAPEPRFVKSYVRRPVNASDYQPAARRDLGAWPLLSRYVTPRGPAAAGDFIIPAVRHFGLPGEMVSGRVCFFMGIV
jgi:hypothetical protein